MESNRVSACGETSPFAAPLLRANTAPYLQGIDCRKGTLRYNSAVPWPIPKWLARLVLLPALTCEPRYFNRASSWYSGLACFRFLFAGLWNIRWYVIQGDGPDRGRIPLSFGSARETPGRSSVRCRRFRHASFGSLALGIVFWGSNIGASSVLHLDYQAMECEVSGNIEPLAIQRIK